MVHKMFWPTNYITHNSMMTCPMAHGNKCCSYTINNLILLNLHPMQLDVWLSYNLTNFRFPRVNSKFFVLVTRAFFFCNSKRLTKNFILNPNENVLFRIFWSFVLCAWTMIVPCNNMVTHDTLLNKLCQCVNTKSFPKSKLNMCFLFHILFKWKKWKSILEIFSKIYTCIIVDCPKFQIISTKMHLNFIHTKLNHFKLKTFK